MALMAKVVERFRPYPTSGWVCQGIEDRGEVNDYCEKCGMQFVMFMCLAQRGFRDCSGGLCLRRQDGR